MAGTAAGVVAAGASDTFRGAVVTFVISDQTTSQSSLGRKHLFQLMAFDIGHHGGIDGSRNLKKMGLGYQSQGSPPRGPSPKEV